MPYMHLACSIDFSDFWAHTQHSDNEFGYQLLDSLVSVKNRMIKISNISQVYFDAKFDDVP